MSRNTPLNLSLSFFPFARKKEHNGDHNIIPISYGPFTNSQLIGYRHKAINGPISQFSVILDKLFHLIFSDKYFTYNKTSPLFYYIKANIK